MNWNKTFWAVLAGILIGFLIGINQRTRQIQGESTKKRWAEEEQIEKQFDADFAFVCDRINERDIEIYSLAEQRDREILAEIERLSATTNDANKHRAELEAQLKWSLNHHVQDCIRLRSRIQENRGFCRAAAHLFDADIYQTKCDCECCREN